MSNDALTIIPKQGWLKIQVHSHSKWHRRYCKIDWDKAILLIATKLDGQTRDWIKLLPHIEIKEKESSNSHTIEIKSDDKIYLLQAETKIDYDMWFLALKRTAYSRIGGGIFGQSLEETYKYSPDQSSLVPLIVRQCCEYLLKYGSTFVGLFRIPGKQSSIRELRSFYDRGIAMQLNSSHSPATISSLLKSYLQSLPEPIVPPDSFDEFLEIGSRLKYNQTEDFQCLKMLIKDRLCPMNYALLSYLCLFLKKLTEFEQETKMDTENLAVTFGNNLIRSLESLDLNMLKGHNYNLLPLIKVLINQSHYLFSDSSIAFQESTDQNNESLAKSSGFSSFSSLLSSHDESLPTPASSSSTPSICLTTCCSSNSVDLTDESYADLHIIEVNCNSDLVTNQQSFTTCFDGDLSSYQDDETLQDDLLNLKPADLIEKGNTMGNRLETENHFQVPHETCSCDGSGEYSSKNELSSPMYNSSSKKTLANRFGKSLINFKSSMSKAFHSNSNSIDITHSNKEVCDSLSDCPKDIEYQIEQLTMLINEKESFLTHLRKIPREQYKKYHEEKVQLNQIIEQLQEENSQLKIRQQSFTMGV